MRNKQIKSMTFAAIIIAFIIILSITPIGFIDIFPGVSITIIHIPVLIGAIILGKKYGALFGLVFGICSFIMAFPKATTNALFTNPLVSILPRVIFGFIISPIYNLFYKIIKNKTLSNVITNCLCTIIHTVIVLVPMFIIWRLGFYFFADDYVLANGNGENANLFMILYSVFITNGVLEVLLSMVVGTPVSLVLKKIIIDGEQK